jgi:predicted negative regulator of RcsB-dependent stress response
MAFDVLDEHEQGELVQKWLRENALAIIVGVGLGLVLIFGWQQWKVHRANVSLEAAARYQSLASAAGAGKAEEAEAAASELREKYPKSPYAVLAALHQAEVAAAANDLDGAAAALAWAREHAGIEALQGLVAIRSARVALARGDADGALALVGKLPADAWPALAGELRGDALVKQGHADAARTAYQDALSHLDEQAGTRSVVQMKLDDLGGPLAAKAPAAPAPAAEKQGS